MESPNHMSTGWRMVSKWYLETSVYVVMFLKYFLEEREYIFLYATNNLQCAFYCFTDWEIRRYLLPFKKKCSPRWHWEICLCCQQWNWKGTLFCFHNSDRWFILPAACFWAHCCHIKWAPCLHLVMYLLFFFFQRKIKPQQSPRQLRLGQNGKMDTFQKKQMSPQLS